MNSNLTLRDEKGVQVMYPRSSNTEQKLSISKILRKKSKEHTVSNGEKTHGHNMERQSEHHRLENRQSLKRSRYLPRMRNGKWAQAGLYQTKRQ